MSDITIQQALDIGYTQLQNQHSNYKNEIMRENEKHPYF